MKKNEERLHRDCEPHDVAHCDINTHNNLEPGVDDCGHRVDGGPGTLDIPDLNTYETDSNGRKFIVAGQPEHNLDQNPEHGPGVTK